MAHDEAVEDEFLGFHVQIYCKLYIIQIAIVNEVEQIIHENVE